MRSALAVMKREYINTALWMVIFAAATFCIIPIVFAVVVFSRAMSDASLELVLWPLRLIFIASPFVALFLGLRRLLPGTKSLVMTKHGGDATSKILTLIVFIIVVMFTLSAWVAFLPPPGRPDISINTLNYTNDASGSRLAKIAVTNLNSTTIFIYAPRIEIKAPTEPRGYEDYFLGANRSWHALLGSGASENFTIPTPTNQLPWRLSFYVYPDRGKSVKNTMKHVVSISCMSVGVWPLFARFLPINGAFMMPYDIEGDWINNEE